MTFILKGPYGLEWGAEFAKSWADRHPELPAGDSRCVPLTLANCSRLYLADAPPVPGAFTLRDIIMRIAGYAGVAVEDDNPAIYGSP